MPRGRAALTIDHSLVGEDAPLEPRLYATPAHVDQASGQVIRPPSRCTAMAAAAAAAAAAALARSVATALRATQLTLGGDARCART